MKIPLAAQWLIWLGITLGCVLIIFAQIHAYNNWHPDASSMFAEDIEAPLESLDIITIAWAFGGGIWLLVLIAQTFSALAERLSK